MPNVTFFQHANYITMPIDAIRPNNYNIVLISDIPPCASPDGAHKLIASGNKARIMPSVAQYKTDTSAGIELIGHEAPITNLNYSPDGKQVITADLSGIVCIWDATTGARLRMLPCSAWPFRALEFSSDSKRFLIGSKTLAQVIDADTGEIILMTTPNSHELLTAAYTPARNCIHTLYSDGILRFWDISSGKVIYKMGDKSNPIQTAAVSRDGNMLATSNANTNSTIQLWNLRNPNMVYRLMGLWEFWLLLILVPMWIWSLRADRRESLPVKN